MSTDVYRKVGRGGAGNWYSEKDVKEAEDSIAKVSVWLHRGLVTYQSRLPVA
jgi:hypothetical protein